MRASFVNLQSLFDLPHVEIKFSIYTWRFRSLLLLHFIGINYFSLLGYDTFGYVFFRHQSINFLVYYVRGWLAPKESTDSL